jgi:hypothetical protein
LKAGWKMNDIDEMDINFFLQLNEDKNNKKEDIEDFYKKI